MVAWLIRASLQHRIFVLLLAAALLVFGAQRAAHMPIDVFPDLTAPRVTVVTESTGMAAEEVEQLITFPVESAVNGTAGLRRLRSASAPGISVVWAEFDWDTNEVVARQRVTERLQGIGGALPAEASVPKLAPASSVMGEIAFVAVTSEQLSPVALRRVAEIDVRRRLLAVQGISQVVPIGGQVKQYHLLVHPDKLEAYGLTLAEVSEAVAHGSRNTPGGYVVEGGQEAVVRVLGRAVQASDLETLVVARRDGTPITVRDLATVKTGAAIARGSASYNAEPAVLLSIVKQPDADTVSTTRRLDTVLHELQTSLEARGVALHQRVFRQQDFIDRALDNLVTVLRDGALLVVIVLFLFLWSMRPTLISLVAIPLSLLAALLVLNALGYTIDTMTLGGLAIAIGELVDDAIVDVENVSRRLRQRALLPPERRPDYLGTVLSASLEIRTAIVSATAILMLVFVPLLLLDGLEGRLLRPLAIAYLAAIFASLVVAITVTPVLCSFLLGRSRKARHANEPPLLRWVSRAYSPVLAATLKRPWIAGALAIAALVGGLVGMAPLGRAFLPEFNEGSLTINMVLSPGTSLHESNALATLAERALMADPGVLSVGRRTGRAEQDEHVLGVETSEIEVRLAPEDERTREQVFSDIRERLKVVPAQFSLGQPISHRIEHMIAGQRGALAVKVFGDDLKQLRRVADAAKEIMDQVPGVVDLSVEPLVEIPQIAVRINAQAAALYGLSPGEVATTVGTALWGTTVNTIYEESTTTDVVVKYPAELTDDLATVRRLRINTPQGASVPLSALADVRRESGPNTVLRENIERRLVITANVEGGDMRALYEAVRTQVSANVALPDGVRIEYAGQFEREEAATQRLLTLGLLSLLGVGFIVATTLGSVRRALIVLVNLPLALAGGVVGVHLAGGVFSIATTIGFITLFGIATRNGILLATRTRDLEQAGKDRAQAVSEAAVERLAPILMTAVTAALGLLPLGLALGQPGSEIQAPMALVILTGLASSTVLNMLVIPPLLHRFGGTHSPTADA